MPSDLLLTLLLIFLIIFVFVLIAVAIQFYFILKQLRVLINRLNELSLEIEKKVNQLLNPIQLLGMWFQNAKQSLHVFDLVKSFFSKLGKHRRS